MKPTSSSVIPGLEGVVAAETRLSSVNGETGELIIAGFPVEELATRASFEEMVYLLWHDALLTARQLHDFRKSLAAHRLLPPATHALLEAAPPRRGEIMDALRMAASTLSLGADGAGDSEDSERDALRLVASFPTIVAAYWRLLRGEKPIAPDPDLGHAANYWIPLDRR